MWRTVFWTVTHVGLSNQATSCNTNSNWMNTEWTHAVIAIPTIDITTFCSVHPIYHTVEDYMCQSFLISAVKTLFVKPACSMISYYSSSDQQIFDWWYFTQVLTVIFQCQSQVVKALLLLSSTLMLGRNFIEQLQQQLPHLNGTFSWNGS